MSAEWWGGFATGFVLFGITLVFAQALYVRSGDYPPVEDDQVDDDEVIDMHQFAERNHHQRGA